MIYLSTLAIISGLYLLAAASPGPNFFIISHLSLSGRRRLAVLVALGIALGSTLWASLAMLGIAALLAQMDWLYAGVRLAGALYLLWFGGKLLLSAAKPSAVARAANSGIGTTLQALRTGLFTSLSNPKSGAFWTGVFATTFPADAPLWFHFVTRVQAGYQSARRLINAICGDILVMLGLRLALQR